MITRLRPTALLARRRRNARIPSGSCMTMVSAKTSPTGHLAAAREPNARRRRPPSGSIGVHTTTVRRAQALR